MMLKIRFHMYIAVIQESMVHHSYACTAYHIKSRGPGAPLRRRLHNYTIVIRAVHTDVCTWRCMTHHLVYASTYCNTGATYMQRYKYDACEYRAYSQCIEERDPYTHSVVYTPATRQDPDTVNTRPRHHTTHRRGWAALP